jgi:hypothetical protein
MTTSINAVTKKKLKSKVKEVLQGSIVTDDIGLSSRTKDESRRYNIVSLSLGGNLPLGEIKNFGISYGFSTMIGYEFKVFEQFVFPKLNKYKYLLPNAKVKIGLNWLLSSDDSEASLKGYDFLIGPAWRHQIAKSKFNIRSSILVGQYVGKAKHLDMEETHAAITVHAAVGAEYQLKPEIAIFIDNRYEYIHSSFLAIQNYNFSIGANYEF